MRSNIFNHIFSAKRALRRWGYYFFLVGGLFWLSCWVLPCHDSNHIQAAGIYIGDSITQGLQNNGVLPASSVVLASTGKTASYFNNGLLNGLPSSADYVYVNLGVNNPSDTSSMKTLLSNLQSKYPNTKIYVGSVLPVAESYSGSLSASEVNQRISSYNNEISSYAQGLGMSYLDVSSGLVDSDGYLLSSVADRSGLHPSGGYNQLAQNISSQIDSSGTGSGSGLGSGTGSGTSTGTGSSGTGSSGTGSTGTGTSGSSGSSGAGSSLTDAGAAGRTTTYTAADPTSLTISELCSNLEGEAASQCQACGEDSLWTALGCLPISTEDLVPKLIEIMMGIAGLLLTIQIIIGASQIIFSNGDSAALTKARTRITNSVIALIFIIFGVVILRIIGVDIFALPGFFEGS